MTRRKTKGEPVPAIGAVEFGGVTFELKPGLLGTFAAVERRHIDDLRKAYAAIVGVDARRVAFVDLKAIVGGAVQNAWYEASGKTIPPRVAQAHAARLVLAAATNRGTNDR